MRSGRHAGPPNVIMRPVDLTPERDPLRRNPLLPSRTLPGAFDSIICCTANHAVAELHAPTPPPCSVVLRGICRLNSCWAIPHRGTRPSTACSPAFRIALFCRSVWIALSSTGAGPAANLSSTRVERLREAHDFLYDLWIQDSEGHIREHWEGLHLRAVAPIERAKTLAAALCSLRILKESWVSCCPEAGLRVRVARGSDRRRES